MAPKIAKDKGSFRSTVADIIDFKPLENPPWRSKTSVCPSVDEMVNEIAGFKHEWDLKIESLDRGLVKDLTRKLEAKFFHHCNVDEDHGLKDSSDVERFLETVMDSKMAGNKDLSLEEQETLNLKDAHSYLEGLAKTETTGECGGFLEESMLREVNKIVLRNIQIPRTSTKPGVYSNRLRITEFEGETYCYQQPDDMMAAVCTLLDRFNSLYAQSLSESTTTEMLQSVFKCLAWLVFELLDLHPFSDGNGRVCRLLCCYVLSALCPFPSPIYNMYSESSMKDFERALVDTRCSADRKPRGLATMIIESNWATWKKLSEIEQEFLRNSCHVPNDLHRDSIIRQSHSCSKSYLQNTTHVGFNQHKVNA